MLPILLIISSTYPRWKNDHEPGFVHELAKRLTGQYHVIAVVPHAPGAAVREMLDGVEVIRYRYAPLRMQNLVNDGGIVTNLRRHPLKMLLVPGFLLSQAWCTWRVLCKRPVRVVHAHWLIPQGLVLAILGVLTRDCPPYLLTSHGADLFALRARWLDVLKRFAVRRAAAVTVVSQAMLEKLTSIGATNRKIVVQSMGVDLEGSFSPDPVAERSACEILFVGRLVEKKGVRHLIDAMPTVLSVLPQARLTIAGFGPEEERLRKQVKVLELGNCVRFIGAVSQQALPVLYRRAGVFVAPFVESSSGDQEGLGLVCLEALGCGCPIVVSDIPATRDLLSRASGFCRVAPGNPVALAEAIVDVIANGDRFRYEVSTSRASLIDRFDWSAVAKRYGGLLREIVEHKS